MNPRDLSQPMQVVLRKLPENFRGRFGLTVCINERPPGTILTVSCGPRGGFAIAAAIEAELKRRNLPVRFSTIKCLGLCESGPNVLMTPSNSWFHGVHEADVPDLLDLVEAQLREAGIPPAI
jgi:(2Fe-2S) ferredoxin